MRVDSTVETSADVRAGDLLVVARSRTAKAHSLVVGVLYGSFTVVRVKQRQDTLIPDIAVSDSTNDLSWEIWGVVTSIIRRP